MRGRCPLRRSRSCAAHRRLAGAGLHHQSAAAGDGKEGTRIRDDIRASSSYEGIRSDYSARASNWRAFEDSRKARVTHREKDGQY